MLINRNGKIRYYDEEKLIYKILYQPQVDSYNQQVIGYEALLRVYNDDQPIRTDIFIQACEASGYIIKLGKWIINKALKDFHHLNELTDQPPILSINISPIQLIENGFRDYVYHLLRKYNINPQHIEFEITETNSLNFPQEHLNDKVRKLSNLGINIGLDDFGTGYSKFSHFMNYPVNTIKLDKTFIPLIKHPETKLKLSQFIHMLDVCHIRVIAEGVETSSQLRSLQEIGVKNIQGYYYSHPQSLEQLISKHNKMLIS
ncbi:EAL domain-containing protein [Acidaminobacter sp. JC074]|uniref:EAL domain-containing protein n=1 Tax=Acidaminobacter sp. JC074 TaxID=2530199 RepID=UPI001F0D6228|nr:EAL domain-containing protein [Acidaminobacter sp. JC074]MCH4891405.1 EAL domain-containing protein [Acidaminobacter sp. JC074]